MLLVELRSKQGAVKAPGAQKAGSESGAAQITGLIVDVEVNSILNNYTLNLYQ